MFNSLMLEILAQADGKKEKSATLKLASTKLASSMKRPPVWLMRQAGRYMLSYQQLRQKHTLDEMFRNPDLITQVTLLPIVELNVDAAILFSDILLLLDAMGIKVGYSQKGVAVETIDRLDDPKLFQPKEAVMGKFSYLQKAICQLKGELKVPLMGFTAAPFTLACYALDGSKAALATKVRKAFWTDRIAFEGMQRQLSDYLFALAKLQVESGAQILQIFDSHTHVLSNEEYGLVVLPVLSDFLKRLETLNVPLVYFSRTSQLFLDQLERLPPCALGIDWQSDMKYINQQSKRVLQGNFNPWKLLNPPSTWQEEWRGFIEDHHDGRTICTLGHGILPQTPWSHVKAFVDTILEFEG